MLEHLSPKFKMPPVEREPRAALILNRFTRNLSIMFATNAVASVLGLGPDQVKDKSFYRCIQERCLPDAVKCLEGAKANDSIAYLRFWSRDPREAEDLEDDNENNGVDGEDHPMADEEDRHSSTSDSEGGGAELDSRMALDEDTTTVRGGIKLEEEDEPMESVPSLTIW
ncbi:putative potassium voltage-dependent transporter [Diaporthe ampelina]|uniref:Putative potassium voltage-dependent transporter n=1 Tax=Diaporthe ampelina TaxID=1214573 RepID=A0A0G2FBR1_9PEZI|nr:putative potassium voltage-dependent transporter [Diaporthe ampelina]